MLSELNDGTILEKTRHGSATSCKMRWSILAQQCTSLYNVVQPHHCQVTSAFGSCRREQSLLGQEEARSDA